MTLVMAVDGGGIKTDLALVDSSGAVLAVTCAAFIGYQYESYRAAARHTVQTLGEVVESNSTAAIANRSHEKNVAAAILGGALAIAIATIIAAAFH